MKVMKVPTSFAAGERAYSIAGHIQSVFRTRLSYQRLHRLLFIYFNSRVLSNADLDAVDVPDDDSCEGAVGREDGEAGGPVGSDASVADM